MRPSLTDVLRGLMFATTCGSIQSCELDGGALAFSRDGKKDSTPPAAVVALVAMTRHMYTFAPRNALDVP